MGSQYKKAVKRLLGRKGEALVARETLSVGAASLSGVATSSRLVTDPATPGSLGIFTAVRPGDVEHVVFELDQALPGGALNVSLVKNPGGSDQSILYSGGFVVSGEKHLAVFYTPTDAEGSEQPLASGDTLEARYAIPTALSLGVTDVDLQARISVAYEV